MLLVVSTHSSALTLRTTLVLCLGRKHAVLLGLLLPVHMRLTKAVERNVFFASSVLLLLRIKRSITLFILMPRLLSKSQA